MQENDKTMRARAQKLVTRNLYITVLDGKAQPKTYFLKDFQKNVITFGREDTNDIVLTSRLVSREHGRFILNNDGQWVIQDKVVFGPKPSRNGLLYNNTYVRSKPLSSGDFIRIDNQKEQLADGVLFVAVAEDEGNTWRALPVEGKKEIRIGRSPDCDIVLPHVSISRHHASIVRENGHYYIVDEGSTNGIAVNNVPVNGKERLFEKDVIAIVNSKLIFTSTAVFFYCYRKGISVDTENVVITRKNGRKTNVTGNNISLNIKPGELVSIIGGSGAGKSTILNCMCGYLPPTRGNVFINGVNLYQNYDMLKQLIGYVPQSDIVYDNLTLYDMLKYTAKLRLPKDTSETEQNEAIEKAINLVDLPDKRDSLIRSLSGGQRKRASIAVELLSDPNLLFLDEPASGLDPGTERNLMLTLRQMANNGKTVILVTHSTLQLKMCDKIVFMGKGGNLCFFGSYDEALQFFGISDIVDVYNMITDSPEKWKNKYNELTKNMNNRITTESAPPGKHKKSLQLGVLCSRYLKLVVNDRQRFLMLLAQAPLLALLISLVADGNQFEQCDMTQNLLFALSCSAFWVGMLNAIQEVCKERTILKREYMAGLSLTAYIPSKILVLGLMCLVQSMLLIGVFTAIVGMPEEGIVTAPFLELLITSFLTALASAAMGIFVSSLFTNADRAMTVAPILLMPQILFSGLIFKLEGATEVLSWITVCRWSMEAYGTTANLNDLPTRMQQEGMMVPEPEINEFYEFTSAHIFKDWGILLLFVIVFLVMARLVLSRIGKEKA